MSIEGKTEYKANVRCETKLGEHLHFGLWGLAQSGLHVPAFELGSCGSETSS